MSKRVLMLVGLAVLWTQGTLFSQDIAQENDRPKPIVQIIDVKYYSVREMSDILAAVAGGDGTQIVVDEQADRLIVRATPDRMAEISGLVAQLDRQTESAPQGEPLLCRVYMVEVPSRQSDLKTFQVWLQLPSSTVSLPDLLKAGEGKKIVIDAFRDEAPGLNGPHRIEIQGRADSVETIMQVLDMVPPGGMERMEFHERTSDLVVPAGQVSQLPEQLRQHIHRLLGDDVQTVGYWFGSMSSPGEIKAPIGPWSIQMEVKPAQVNGLSINVDVSEWRGDSAYSILSNSIQGKVGKPIIVGYNRLSAGTRTMGAMVIILEADTSEAGGS